MKLSPGYIRGLAWIAERHPNLQVEIEHVQDAGNAGWLQAKIEGVPMRGTSNTRSEYYILSPLGRVWHAKGMDWAPPPITKMWEFGKMMREGDYDGKAGAA